MKMGVAYSGPNHFTLKVGISLLREIEPQLNIRSLMLSLGIRYFSSPQELNVNNPFILSLSDGPKFNFIERATAVSYTHLLKGSHSTQAAIARSAPCLLYTSRCV